MSDSASVPLLSFTNSLLVSGVAALCVSILPAYLTPNSISLLIIVLIPLLGYLLSLAGSAIYQTQKCKKVNGGSIVKTNLFIYAILTGITTWLFIEDIPFLKFFFGKYADAAEVINQTNSENSESGTSDFDPDRKFKIQPLSGVVKKALPEYVPESVKSAFAYFYWIFWGNMLPSFFIFTVQGASC